MKRRIADLEQYMHTTADRWRWRPAAGTDVADIVDMAQGYFGSETAGIFINDPVEYSRTCTLAIVNQFYNPRTELFTVARDTATNQLLGYTWAVRNERAPWSREEMIAIRIAHVALAIPVRERVFLCAQMLRTWEKWAEACDIKIICSSTIRADQPGFLRLHREADYVVRGSIAYKRLTKATFVIDEADASMVHTTINAKNTSYDRNEYNSHTTDHSVSSGQFRAAG
jgi:hypothetical protein